MWQEAIGHVVGCWTNDEYEFEGKFWRMPRRRVLPKPVQKPHPPLFGATSSDDGHRQVGALGLGLCSFAVGVSPEEVKQKIDIYREAVEKCTDPVGAYVNNQAATFTMTLCADDRGDALELARESFEWYPKTGARQIATLAGWMAEAAYSAAKGNRERAFILNDVLTAVQSAVSRLTTRCRSRS